MKRILSLIVLLLITSISYSKPTAIDSLKQRIQSLENGSNKSLLLTDSLVQANISLSKEIDYSEKLLEKYNNLNNIVFTVIGLLFAFFGIILPLIGYFFIVQPAKENIKESQKLLDDTRNNLDKLFSEYIIKNRDTLIDNALTQLENDNTPEISNSINYLNSQRHSSFNDKQILRIILLVKKEHKDIYTFLKLLCSTESIFTTDFFRDYLKKNPFKENQICTWAAIYAAKYGKDEFLDDIAEYIIQSKCLGGVCASVDSESHSYLLKIYNNEKLAKGIDSETLINHMSYHDKHNDDESALEKSERQNTTLYKKYLEVRPPESKQLF